MTARSSTRPSPRATGYLTKESDSDELVTAVPLLSRWSGMLSLSASRAVLHGHLFISNTVGALSRRQRPSRITFRRKPSTHIGMMSSENQYHLQNPAPSAGA